MGPVEDHAESHSDAELVARIAADPTAGWAQAWHHYGHRLHTYCCRLLDNPSEADDAVADVFLVASRRIDGLRNPEAFGAWMFAIARRRVQQTWRERERSVPVDPHGATVMTAATTDLDRTGVDDAAELIAAASHGLSDRDRDLLALALGSDLDTGEMARITGESVRFVSVRVTRLKERVARAAGALLVARHHRRDCDVLAQLLAQWDGRFDEMWRKRISRHVDACTQCSDRRKSATAVFAAPLLFAPPADALRDRLMGPISSRGGVVPDLGPWDRDGFPHNDATTRKLRFVLGIAAAVAIIAALIIGVGAHSKQDGSALVAAMTSLSTPTSTPVAPTTPTTATTTTVGPTTTTTSVPPAPVIDASEPNEPVTDPVASTETTLPAPPTVTLSLSPTSMWTGTDTSQATVVVIARSGNSSTVISWDGPEDGSVTVAGEGTHIVTIGPFATAPPSQDVSGIVTVTATTTDGFDRVVSTTASLTVTAVPI